MNPGKHPHKGLRAMLSRPGLQAGGEPLGKYKASEACDTIYEVSDWQPKGYVKESVGWLLVRCTREGWKNWVTPKKRWALKD